MLNKNCGGVNSSPADRGRHAKSPDITVPRPDEYRTPELSVIRNLVFDLMPVSRRMTPAAKRPAIPITVYPHRARPWRIHPVAARPNPLITVPLPFPAQPDVARTGCYHDRFSRRRRRFIFG